jgi:acetyl esterase/lipase
MRMFWTGLALVLSATPAFAQAPTPDMMKAVPVAAPKATGIPLITDAPDTEQWERYFGQTMVRNVTRPALYPMLPKAGTSNGKAVIVVPGGGYQFVSMDSEGFRVGERLAAAGYTAFILKYRPMPTTRDPAAYMAALAAQFGNLGNGDLADYPPAVDDLAAAIRLVSTSGAKWKIDPAQIGVIGFSAGSRTAIRVIEQRPEAKLLRHNALIYPPMVNPVTGGPRPPLFLAIAVDDPLFRQGGLALVEAWLKESAKTEFHLYSGGSHGFGMRRIGTTSDHWIDQYLAWLGTQ